mgnify:CR=1 FL=1
MSKRLIIVENGYRGHQRYWISLILDNANLILLNYDEIVLLLSRDLIEMLDLDRDKLQHVTLRRIESSTYSFAHRLRKEINIIKQAGEFVIDTNSRLMFLTLDDVLLGLIFTKRYANYMIEGVLFQPPLRMKYVRFSRFLKLRIKRLMIKASLSNILKIYVLNDYNGVRALNHVFSKKIFYELPDPIPWNIQSTSDKLDGNVKNNKQILIFGSINARKGVKELLNCLADFSYISDSDSIEIRICGKVDISLKESLNLLIKKINASESKISVRLENRFVSDGEIPKLLSTADLIWLGYIDFVWSSGVLGLAVSAGVPVLTFEGGLISELVCTYNFGYSIPKSRHGIMNFLSSFSNIQFELLEIKETHRLSYLEKNSESRFISRLFDD